MEWVEFQKQKEKNLKRTLLKVWGYKEKQRKRKAWNDKQKKEKTQQEKERWEKKVKMDGRTKVKNESFTW